MYCAVTIAFAWVSYRQYEADFRSEVEGRLTAIAELKAKEVAAWYRERSSDARYFVDNESVLALIRQFDTGQPTAATLHALEDTFRRMQENHGYRWIGYYDAAGVRLITVPAGAPEDRHMVEETLRVAARGEVVFLDLHNDDDGIPHFAIVAPMHSAGAPRRRPRGAVVLRVDARRALTPFLSSWPIPADTAELLLVRRDGDDVVYLNAAFGIGSGADGVQRAPLSRTGLPAVQVVTGDNNLVEAVNRLGSPVIAVGRAVEGTPWHLVASQSRAELISPLDERALVTTTIAGLLLLVGVAAFVLVWREHGRRLAESERQALATLTTMAQVVDASPAVLF
ncbi:MAG: hypothetical protein AMXMBFR57_17560 [Acidimicrobiia bacterium]